MNLADAYHGLFFFLRQQSQKLLQNPRRGAPDGVVLVLIKIDRKSLAVFLVRFLPKLAPVPQGRQGHLDYLLYFMAVYLEGVGIGNEGDKRRDAIISADRGYVVQLPQDTRIFFPNSHFFFGLAQSGGQKVLVLFILPPARKRDLPFVVLHRIGPTGEEDVIFPVFFKERD